MSTDLSIHDNFIRSILSNKKIAIDYFKACLPAAVSKWLDFSTLTQLPDTYLSEELQKTMSDIVYSCHRKDGNSAIKVSLLIEHKSYFDKYTPIQIGSYIFSALQKQVANKEPLSLVIPVLLYHGKDKWQYQTLSGLFENIDKDWKQYLPDFEFIYNNLGQLADTEVERLNNKFLQASFLALKHSFEKEWLGSNAVKLLLLASAGPKELQKGFIIYLYNRGELKGEKVLNSLPEPIKNTVMNTLDIYIERGRKEGIEKGRKEGIEKGKQEVIENLILKMGLTDLQAADIAGVPLSFIKKIRSGLKKK